MVNTPSPSLKHRNFFSQKLAVIVGCICLIGFLIDILVIGTPPDPLAPQWRLNFLQQVAERSLLLFVGSVLLLYGQLDGQLKQLKIISITCLVVGILLGLSSFVVIRDTLILQDQAIDNINIQAAELRDRIVQGREDPSLNQQISDAAFSAALSSVDSQTEVLRQDIQTGATKALISSAGNLLLMSIGLVSVGRLSLLQSLSSWQKRRFSLRQVG